MRIRIPDVQAIGGLRGASMKAPFARAPLVVRLSDGTLCEVHRYLSETTGSNPTLVEGDPLTQEEWTALRTAGEAFEFRRPRPVRPFVGIWVFRPSFGLQRRIDAIRDLSTRDPETISEDIEATTVCLVDERACGPVRDEWFQLEFDDACTALASGATSEAIDAAHRAFLLDRQRSPQSVAVYVVALEQARRFAKAQMVRAFDVRSRKSSAVDDEIAHIRAFVKANPIQRIGVNAELIREGMALDRQESVYTFPASLP